MWIKAIAVLASLIALIGGTWWVTRYYVGLGHSVCEAQDSVATVKKLGEQLASIEHLAATNRALEAQHEADLSRVAAATDRAAALLSRVRVRVPACGGAGVSQAPAAPAGSQPAGALDGHSGEGVEEVDASSIVSDLRGCELDAADLNLMKAWAKSVTQ